MPKGTCKATLLVEFSAGEQLTTKVLQEALSKFLKTPASGICVDGIATFSTELEFINAVEWTPPPPTSWSEVFNGGLGVGGQQKAKNAARDAGYKYLAWNGTLYAIVPSGDPDEVGSYTALVDTGVKAAELK